MSELQKAIEEITYVSSTFPKDAFQVITANKEEAIPYLREGVEYVLSKNGEVEDDYQLCFYAMYLLGEFQDREFFQKIMEFVSMPGDEVEDLLGDCVTESLRDILYNTYNGDIELLKKSIQNKDVNEYVRSAMLDVMGQLYLDGVLEENEWKDFLKQSMYNGGEYDYLYNAIGRMLCRCHFVDMLPEIQYMFDEDLIETIVMGGYDSYVDAMFQYREREERFCKTPIKAANILRPWAMFKDESENSMSDKSKKDFDKMIRAINRERNTSVQKVKIGRNDPCPCGSGKKYKFCCMNKPKNALDSIESPEERNKWLKNYPYTGEERVEGRIYLEDYFDAASIELDKLLYLAFKRRSGSIFTPDREEGKRKKEYLCLAFQKWAERMEKEQISSFADYDEKYSIHYRCEEWMGELSQLLEESNDRQMYKEVTEWIGRCS